MLGLAGPALRDRDVGRERRGPRERHMHATDVRDDAREGVGNLGLADQAEGRDVVARASGADRLKPRPLAHREGLRHKDVLGRPARDVAGELAEGALGLAHVGEDLALDHDLGRRGDVQVDGRARRDLQRLAQEPAHHLELADVGRGIGEGAHRYQRVESQHDRARQRAALGLGAPLVLEHAPAGVEADPHAVAGLELKAVIPLGLDAGVGVARDEHSGGEVATRVAGEVARHG